MQHKKELKIEYVPTKSVKLDTRNARTHSAIQVQQVADSISAFGFTNPILIDGDRVLIAGEGRLLAARSLGLKTVPAIVLDHLSERERRAYAIADNKISLNSSWDFKKLSEELDYLIGEEFDIDSVGFSDSELEMILRDDGGIIPDNTKDIFVSPHYRDAPNGTAAVQQKERKEVYSVSVNFKTESQRDDFLDEMKKRKLRAIILK